jgi:hypothetical protein
MMKKRDLKADLECCKELEPISLKIKRHLIVALGRRAKGVTVFERWVLNAIDGWPYAIRQALEEKERADKCEALVRELVETLEHVEHLANLARINSHNPNAVKCYGAEIKFAAKRALTKAKEALGEEQRNFV